MRGAGIESPGIRVVLLQRLRSSYCAAHLLASRRYRPWEGVTVGQSSSASAEGAPRPVSANHEKTRQSLLAEVHRTRSRAAQLEREAAAGATSVPLLRARRAALEALENYSAALGLGGWPTPRRMVGDSSCCAPSAFPQSQDFGTGKAPRVRPLGVVLGRPLRKGAVLGTSGLRRLPRSAPRAERSRRPIP
jgi:hypothetical protein